MIQLRSYESSSYEGLQRSILKKYKYFAYEYISCTMEIVSIKNIFFSKKHSRDVFRDPSLFPIILISRGIAIYRGRTHHIRIADVSFNVITRFFAPLEMTKDAEVVRSALNYVAQAHSSFFRILYSA